MTACLLVWMCGTKTHRHSRWYPRTAARHKSLVLNERQYEEIVENEYVSGAVRYWRMGKLRERFVAGMKS